MIKKAEGPSGHTCRNRSGALVVVHESHRFAGAQHADDERALDLDSKRGRPPIDGHGLAFVAHVPRIHPPFFDGHAHCGSSMPNAMPTTPPYPEGFASNASVAVTDHSSGGLSYDAKLGIFGAALSVPLLVVMVD